MGMGWASSPIPDRKDMLALIHGSEQRRGRSLTTN